MPAPLSYRPPTGSIPEEPGVYKFRDPRGQVIYVGKAKSLRSRLNSYFADITQLHPRTARMVTTAASVEWTVVSTEVEALQLEYNWIKEFDPRFNVRYRDDKSYPELAVTMGEEFPRLQVMRGPHRKGVRYFGPYAHAWAIRETLDLLLRVFPARTCSAGVFRRAQQIGRPCLLGDIGKCSAPCVGRVSPEEHRDIVDRFCDFMAGRSDALVRKLERRMHEAAEDLDFERAARLRDDIGALRRALEKQAVVLGDGTDADVVGIRADELLAAVQVFHVRGGRVRGQRGWIVDVDAETERVTTDPASPADAPAAQAAALSAAPTVTPAPPTTTPGAVDAAPDPDDEAEDTAQWGQPAPVVAALVENFLLQFYGGRALDDPADDTPTGGRTAVPREILVPVLPPDVDGVTAWLSDLRGSKVSLRVARRGDKRALASTVARNAAEALAQHRLKRASDLTARAAALSELAETLGMDTAPLRIECIDISHVQGTNVVASLVVFEDGMAKKSDYRKFIIRDRPGDDVASIAEVVRRRFSGGVATPPPETELAGERPEVAPGIDPRTGRARRFAYPPQLLVVDGGGPQVRAAAAVLDDLGVNDVTVIGLAKRLEEVWVPDDEDPVIFPRTSEALYLLQRLRDEAHRFAITFHRAKRSKSMITSALDGVPGLGPSRRAALVKHFGSVAAVRAAGPDALTAVPGFGPSLAAAVHAALHGTPDTETSGTNGTDTPAEDDTGHPRSGQETR